MGGDEVTGEPERSNPLDLMESALARQGFRHTLPRRTILQVVASIGHQFTPSELTAEVAKADPGIGRASVFRVLQLLRTCGLVERLHAPDAEVYTLCLTAGHHHHVTCRVCGRTEVFSLEDDGAVARAVERVGYSMENHVLQAFGVCPACRGASGRGKDVPPL